MTEFSPREIVGELFDFRCGLAGEADNGETFHTASAGGFGQENWIAPVTSDDADGIKRGNGHLVMCV